MLLFIIGSLLIIGVIAHAFGIIIVDIKTYCKMNVSDLYRKEYGSNYLVSKNKVRRALFYKRTLNITGGLLGIFTLVFILAVIIYTVYNHTTVFS